MYPRLLSRARSSQNGAPKIAFYSLLTSADENQLLSHRYLGFALAFTTCENQYCDSQ